LSSETKQNDSDVLLSKIEALDKKIDNFINKNNKEEEVTF